MKKWILAILIILILCGIGSWGYQFWQLTKVGENLLRLQIKEGETSLIKLSKEYETLKNSDQILINQILEAKIATVEASFKNSLKWYERILDLGNNAKVATLQESWAKILSWLGVGNYEQAEADLKLLETNIKKVEQEIVLAKIPTNVPVKNEPPKGGAGKQVVKTDGGDFMVSIISADLANTKLVIETASESDCRDNCMALPLAELAKKAGAYAAINGPYFCPATYPSCSDKKNSFDTLLMNRNKVYFNSDNNVYSTNPVAIFSGESRFVEKGMEWGRDTGVDGVVMGRPLLVLNGEVKFFGNSDEKETSRGNRTFLGASGKTVYIGVVYGATVAQAAGVIATMGIKNAINLDSGGSVALWQNGKYLLGPGRNLPIGIMLVRR